MKYNITETGRTITYSVKDEESGACYILRREYNNVYDEYDYTVTPLGKAPYSREIEEEILRAYNKSVG